MATDEAVTSVQIADEDSVAYEELVENARNSDLSDMDALSYIEMGEEDSRGRPLVIVYGARVPVNEVDMAKFLMHFALVMDEITKEDYTFIYFNSKVSTSNLPSFLWLLRTYRLLPYRYKKNLARLSIVHPSLWTRALAYSMYPFISTKSWRKIHFADHADELFLDKIVSQGQIPLPPEYEEHQKELEAYLKETQRALESGVAR